MFPQKSPFCPLFGSFYPHFAIQSAFQSGTGQPLSATQGKRVATFALVTTVGPQPRPARSTPGEPGRAADRQAFAAWFKRRSQLRGAWGRRPQIRGWRAGGSLAVSSPTPATPLLSPAKIRELNHAACRAARFPRVNEHTPAHRRSAWATRGLGSHTELPKSLRTIPTYIVYDNVTQCFGHELLSGAMRFSEEPNDRLHWLRTEGPGTFRLQGNVSGHCRLMGAQSLTCLEYFRTLGRVDLGGCPPKSPTDPGLHITRTRFLIS